MMRTISFLALILISNLSYSQTVSDTIRTQIFDVVYSESYEQPIFLSYDVECPLGKASRSGMNFYTVSGYHTSDDKDYVDNVYDKGHLAPAAAFNCDRETLKLTFSYLNCALQHEGLNRGPWKELEAFERDLAKIYDNVHVEITVNFSENPEKVPGGASIPESFDKIIRFGDRVIAFRFPNLDVAGEDWSSFMILEW